MAKRHDYSNLKMIVEQSKSIADVCRLMDIRPVGGNYKTLKQKMREMNINTKHFTGRGWLRGKTHKHQAKFTMERVLQKNSMYNSHKLRKRLIEEGYKKFQCEFCKLETWNGLPIPLELDHLNGDNTDNRLENLRILCNNCHAQTENYRGKNKLSALSEKKRVEFFKFGETLTCNDDGNPEPSIRKNEGVET